MPWILCTERRLLKSLSYSSVAAYSSYGRPVATARTYSSSVAASPGTTDIAGAAPPCPFPSSFACLIRSPSGRSHPLSRRHAAELAAHAGAGRTGQVRRSTRDATATRKAGEPAEAEEGASRSPPRGSRVRSSEVAFVNSSSSPTPRLQKFCCGLLPSSFAFHCLKSQFRDSQIAGPHC